MLRVADEFTAPPGGWNAEIPATGAAWRNEPDFHGLVAKVRTNLEANGLEGNAEAIIHQQTAKRLLREGHTAWVGNPPARRSWLDLWKGTKVFSRMQARKVLGKPVFVPEDQAEQRASICLDCPQNVVPKDDKWISQWAGGMMRESVEGRTTSRDERLGVCNLCKCELRAAVWLRDDIAKHGITPQLQATLPKYCWKKTMCLKGCGSKN